MRSWAVSNRNLIISFGRRPALGPCLLRLFGMPWCSVLLLSSGLSYVVFCWGLSVLFRSGQGCPGFAREVLVGHPVWCVSVLVCSVRGLCL